MSAKLVSYLFTILAISRKSTMKTIEKYAFLLITAFFFRSCIQIEVLIALKMNISTIIYRYISFSPAFDATSTHFMIHV